MFHLLKSGFTYCLRGCQSTVGMLFAVCAGSIASIQPAHAVEASAASAPASMRAQLADNYQAVAAGARSLQNSTAAYCKTHSDPNADSNDAVKAVDADFEKLAMQWSTVDFIRIGPYRDDLAGQRMQYWPDRRSKGAQQREQVLSSRPAELTSLTSLRQQSIALQGLPGFENAWLARESAAAGDGFVCAYLGALTEGMVQTSSQLAEGFSVGSRAASQLSFEQWLEVIRSGLQMAAEVKLPAVQRGLAAGEVGTLLDITRAVPFSASGMAFEALAAEVRGAAQLLNSAELPAKLTGQYQGFAASVSFQLEQVISLLDDLASLEGEPLDKPGLEELNESLTYAAGALEQANRDLVATVYPALGFTKGFNSLDGD